MKKSVKAKAVKSKVSSKRAAAAEPELPGLVAAMTKLVERLESLERKTDLVLGRVSNFPSEIRNAVQSLPRPSVSQGSVPQHPNLRAAQNQAPAHAEVRRERTMYQAVCADCRKSCEVPFRPTEDRPIYCKACFAVRKAGRSAQAPNSQGFQPHKNPLPFSPASPTSSGNALSVKSSKHKPARSTGAKAKKRK